MSADPLLTGPQAAARCGIDPATWRSYVRKGYVPPADDPDDDRPPNRRRPRWRTSTVETYRTNRAGQGARTDLAETQRERRGHPFYPAATEAWPAMYSTEDVDAADKVIVAHYFLGACDWWVVEYDAEEGRIFCYACLGDPVNAEWGYASLPEMEELTIHGGLYVVERDLHWTPVRFAEIRHACVL